jgi:ABC-2 type transport system permease protein
LLARFTGSPSFALVAAPASQADAAHLVDLGQALMILRIGQRFSADLKSGQPPTVEIMIDGRRSSTALVVQGYAAAIVADFAAEMAAQAGRPPPPAVLVERAWFNPDLLSRWFVIPGLVAILTLVVTLVTTALSVARERELGTLDQLLVTPLVPWQILLGKTIPALLIGQIEGAVIGLVGAWWFGVPFTGSVLLLGLSLFVYLLSAIGVGLMISSLANTQQQAILGAFMFMMPSVLLSGFATPITSMPEWIQWVTVVNPMRYFLVIVRGVFLRDIGWALIWPQLWPMLTIGLVNLAISQWLFRHRIG